MKLEVIKKEVNPLVENAKEIKIKSKYDLVTAADMLSKFNKYSDAVEEEKQKVTKPLNEALKAERGRWKPIEEVLDKAIGIVRGKITDYQTSEVRKLKEKENKIAEKISSGKISLDTGIEKIESLGSIDNQVVAESGMIKFKTVKKFEVVDLVKLPMAYHLADEVGIRKCMVAGVELPGVRYYEEQVPANYR